MRIGSLFSGAGGLDLAVEAVFSGTVVWQAEIDKAASKVLAHAVVELPEPDDPNASSTSRSSGSSASSTAATKTRPGAARLIYREDEL